MPRVQSLAFFLALCGDCLKYESGRQRQRVALEEELGLPRKTMEEYEEEEEEVLSYMDCCLVAGYCHRWCLFPDGVRLTPDAGVVLAPPDASGWICVSHGVDVHFQKRPDTLPTALVASIHLVYLHPPSKLRGTCWILTQLSWGEGRVPSWTSGRFIAGPHGDKQQFTLTKMPPVN